MDDSGGLSAPNITTALLQEFTDAAADPESEEEREEMSDEESILANAHIAWCDCGEMTVGGRPKCGPCANIEKIKALTALVEKQGRVLEEIQTILRTNDNAGLACYRIKDAVDAALSTTPASEGEIRQLYCPCGGIILADTEDWKTPVCDECYTEMGEPKNDPAKNA